MFALGTYILNSPEDGTPSDLATSIDHNITVRLLGLLTDGSPIVRQVSVCTILVLCELLPIDLVLPGAARKFVIV